MVVHFHIKKGKGNKTKESITIGLYLTIRLGSLNLCSETSIRKLNEKNNRWEKEKTLIIF